VTEKKPTSAVPASKSTATNSGVKPPPTGPSLSEPVATGKSPVIWPLWVAILLLVVTLVMACGWFWQQMQSWQGKVDLALEQSQSSSTILSQSGQHFETRLGQLDINVERQKTQLDDLKKQLDQTARRILTVGETGRTDWLLAESEYLLRLANQRLHMERDYLGSLAILKAADEVLAETKEAAVFPVRKSLAKEIVSLEAVADIDRQGIYLKLEALIQQIESLDQRLFFHEAPLLNETPTGTAVAPEETWYERTLNTIKKLDRYFVIRHRDDRIEPLLAPEQIYYLRQNLRLMLEQAELGLLDKNQQVYLQSLGKAQSWVQTHFITNSPVTKAMIKNLEELKAHNIDPNLPDISESLHLLRGLLEAVYRRSGSDSQSLQSPAVGDIEAAS